MNSCDLNITRKYRFLLNLLNVFEMKFSTFFVKGIPLVE